MKTIKVKIFGNFQGGFLKKLIKDRADELGIRGFVRSDKDLSLEIFIEGVDERVKLMIEVLKTEAERAKAKDIKIERIAYQGFEGFKNSSL